MSAYSSRQIGVLARIICCFVACSSSSVAAGAESGGRAIATSWLVCGPFPNDWHEGYYTDFLAAAGGELGIVPHVGLSHLSEGVGPVAWREYRAGADGRVDFNALYGSYRGDVHYRHKVALAYAFTTLQSETRRRAALLLKRKHGVQLWLNNELIYDSRPYWRGDDLLVVDLQPGENRLLVKASRFYAGWEFTLRELPLTSAILVEDWRALLPDLRAGESTAAWGTIPVFNAGIAVLDSIAVNVVENELFAASAGGAGRIEPGQTRGGHFWVATKRPVKPSEEPQIELQITGGGAKTRLSLPLRVRTRDEYFTTTHRSRVDGSIQPYDLLVPTTYDPHKAYPLVVTMHGLGVPVGDLIGNYQLREWCLIASPHGRGQTGYRNIGRIDVFEVMDAIAERYHIDPDRFYLTGHSMGGNGSWYLGLHYPDRFAAIAPLSGPTDYRLRLPGVLAGREKLPDHQLLLLEESAPFRYAENALHLPAFCRHGVLDPTTNIEHPRRLMAVFDSLGYDHINYREEPDRPHWWGADLPGKLDFLRRHRRVQNPREVVFNTNDLRSSKAYWVRIDQLCKSHEFARVHARLAADNHIVAQVEGASQFTMQLNEDLVDLQSPLRLAINQIEATIPQIPASGRLTVRPPLDGESPNSRYAVEIQPGLWMEFDRNGEPAGYARAIETPRPRKRPGLSGPLADVFTGPFILVYGTAGDDPKEVQVNRREALQAAINWRSRTNGDCEIRSDRAVTLGDIDRAHLILFGGPNSNSLTARLAAHLPIALEEDALVVGERRFTAPDAGVKMIYPNPLNPDRYVVVNAGISWRGTQLIDRLDQFTSPWYQRHLPLPDYVVFDGKSFANSGPLLTAGFFDENWQLAD